MIRLCAFNNYYNYLTGADEVLTKLLGQGMHLACALAILVILPLGLGSSVVLLLTMFTITST